MAQVPTNSEEFLPTRNSLLSRLRNRDDSESWQDFFQTYWKLVYSVARQAGLTHHESEEVVQETVITVSRRIPEFHYDPAVCSFKTWLMNLTRWRIVDQLRKRSPKSVQEEIFDSGPATSLLHRVPDPAGSGLEALWESEWREHLLERATDAVKREVSPEQYQVFDLYVVKKWPVHRITRELGVSAASVYLAKHRVSTLVRKRIKGLEKQVPGSWRG